MLFENVNICWKYPRFQLKRASCATYNGGINFDGVMFYHGTYIMNIKGAPNAPIWREELNKSQSNTIESIEHQSNSIEYQSNQSNLTQNFNRINRILPRISDSIDIRLRSIIESQSIDCIRLYSIDSIGIFVRFRSIDIVWI